MLFHDDPRVVRAVRDFAHAATNRKVENSELVTVLRAMCRNLRIPDEALSNADFETVFKIHTEGHPIPITLAVGQTVGAQPQVVVFGTRTPNSPPFTVTILDIVAAQQFHQQFQHQLMQAQAAQRR